jgi:hypothetical protein
MRDRTAGVARENAVEAFDRGAELERMQQSDASVEIGHDARRAAATVGACSAGFLPCARAGADQAVAVFAPCSSCTPAFARQVACQPRQG